MQLSGDAKLANQKRWSGIRAFLAISHSLFRPCWGKDVGGEIRRRFAYLEGGVSKASRDGGSL
jgi:hypothetical protein